MYCYSLPAHVEIAKLAAFDSDDMYSLLHLHLHELFGDDYSQTKLSQSFDEAKDVFRFDLKPEGMIP